MCEDFLRSDRRRASTTTITSAISTAPAVDTITPIIAGRDRDADDVGSLMPASG